jgi:hypothetical protein
MDWGLVVAAAAAAHVRIVHAAPLIALAAAALECAPAFVAAAFAFAAAIRPQCLGCVMMTAALVIVVLMQVTCDLMRPDPFCAKQIVSDTDR